MLRVVVAAVLTVLIAGTALDTWARHDAQSMASRALTAATDEFSDLDDSDVGAAAYGVPLLGAQTDEDLPPVRITELPADNSFTFQATGERWWRRVCLQQAGSVGVPPAAEPQPCAAF